MLSLLNDLSRAVRGLRKSPALAAGAIISLALGIGPNVTVFSVVREMILDDLSAHRPDRLARVEGLDVSYAMYRDLRAAGPFQDLAFYRGLSDRIWRSEKQSEIVWTVTTSANFFDVLGIRASAGRLYSRADEGREIAVVTRLRPSGRLSMISVTERMHEPTFRSCPGNAGSSSAQDSRA